MLLSTCLLIFIIWTCCYLSCTQRPKKRNPNQETLNQQTTTDTMELNNLESKAQPPTTTQTNNTIVEEYTDLNENTSDINIKDQNSGYNYQKLNRPHRQFTKKNFHLIRNLPQLTNSQVKRDYRAYTIDCRRRYEQLINQANPSSDKGNYFFFIIIIT